MKRLLILTAAIALLAAGTASARPAAEKPKPLDGNAVIGFDGVGAIELGMTIDQARTAAGPAM